MEKPVEKEGTWIDWMRKIPEVARAEIVSPESPGSRQAILRYEQLWSDAEFSIHRVYLDTGRMHQIRLQFASRGHPVLGDAAYGSVLSGYRLAIPMTCISRSMPIGFDSVIRARHGPWNSRLHSLRFGTRTL